MGLFTLCLEISWGGKHRSCNSTNTPRKYLNFKKIIAKGNTVFSVQFIVIGRSEIFLDKQDSDLYPSRCESVHHLHARVCALTWLSLIATLHLEIWRFQCNMQLGDMLPLPKTNNNLLD